MATQLDVRAGDMRFALDQLRRGMMSDLVSHLDLEHMAAMVHLFGGATAAAAMAHDPRLKAAANVDGTLYGPIIEARLDRPFLLLQSDHAETGHSDAFVRGNQNLIDQLLAPAWHFEIQRANHYSFTDAPLFLAAPARLALSKLIGGGRGPVETHRASADILDAFLQGPLGGAPGNVEAAAAAYADILAGASASHRRSLLNARPKVA